MQMCWINGSYSHKMPKILGKLKSNELQRHKSLKLFLEIFELRAVQRIP